MNEVVATGPALKRRRIEEGQQQHVAKEINELPEEILLYILSFIIPRFPYLLRLNLVCKFWRELISKPSTLWSGSHHYTGCGKRF